MGEVYRARDPQLKRDVAIKVIIGYTSHDTDRLRRFEQEARAAAALNHPNILSIYQMGTLGSRFRRKNKGNPRRSAIPYA